MKIEFLGVGGAFDPEVGNSAALVETGPHTGTLIDCGYTTYGDLRRCEKVDHVTHVLLTHLHDDHCGSLGALINHHFHLMNRKLALILPIHLLEPTRALLQLQRTNRPMEEVVEFLPIPDEGNPVAVEETMIHYLDTTGLHQRGMPSAAYFLRNATEAMAYSGDLSDPNVLFGHLDVLGFESAQTTVFHDVSFSEEARHSHAYYKDVERYLGQWKLYGYHNMPSARPADCLLELAADHFLAPS